MLQQYKQQKSALGSREDGGSMELLMDPSFTERSSLLLQFEYNV